MKKKISINAIVYIGLAVILTLVSTYIFIPRSGERIIQVNDREILPGIDEDRQELIEEAESLITIRMGQGQIPGLSIVIVEDGETLYKAGFSNADRKTEQPITTDTQFQIASNSKAFTSLCVFQLEKDGLINLSDPISKYIPWLKLVFEGQETNVTIEELLYHTSGIPSNTISRIPELGEENSDAIEETVRGIAGLELVSRPGTKYQYATINYDVLGLLIEKVSGMKYEVYMKTYVLEPAGLEDTYMYESEAFDQTPGYKWGFGAPQRYEAPWYEGNKPAGYIISSADDMAEWLQIQMNTSVTSSLDSDLVTRSQIPDCSVDTFGLEMSYAAGWIVYDNAGTEIFHSGSNPNFSSFIMFRPDEKIGVAVLSNMYSPYTMDIAQSVTKLFSSSTCSYPAVDDYNRIVDQACTAVLLISFYGISAGLYSFGRSIYRLALKKDELQAPRRKKAIQAGILSFIIIATGVMIHFVPVLLFNGVTWEYLTVWNPISIQVLYYFLYALLFVFLCNVLIKPFRSQKEKCLK